MLRYMPTQRVIARPWVTSWASRRKTAATAFEIVCGWSRPPSPSLWRHSYRRVSVLSVLSRHRWVVECQQPAAVTPLTEFSYIDGGDIRFSDAYWGDCGGWQHWVSHIERPHATAGPSVICLVSDLPLPYAAITLSPPWLGQQTVWCNTNRDRKPNPRPNARLKPYL